MATMSTFDSLTKLKKPELLNITDEFGLKNLKNKQKKELIKIILEFKDVSDKYTPIKINETIYNKIYHISDIHIRPLKRHIEYNEVFNNLYSFLDKDISSNNIIAILPITTPKYIASFDNNSNFVFKTRNYLAPVNLKKISIKFLGPEGELIDLKYTDFAFCLQVSILYDNVMPFNTIDVSFSA